ncbi:Response regulator rcp1 [Rubripirellula tenax]|uniref:Response regulator rcp1 n=1 Tax=Rubripirellula tenax TaxID=2528015 RepID=A0A5C6EKW3_9BACT|nr:response regulator [Rubripirellula tenax]TWU48747.1 Response regulator rcp1 [Rubripirellula tenax]
MLNVSNNKPMEILLVEDGWTDARVTIFALRRSRVHHRLTLVRTVGEAIAFLRREGVFARAPHPDLLLLDMMLPDGSGLDVLAATQSMTDDESNHCGPTTVVLTASRDADLRKQCDELKVHDYMRKPVSEEDFMRVVRDHKKLMIHSTPILESVLS